MFFYIMYRSCYNILLGFDKVVLLGLWMIFSLLNNYLKKKQENKGGVLEFFEDKLVRERGSGRLKSIYLVDGDKNNVNE